MSISAPLAAVPSAPILLWSATCWLKHIIGETYYKQHYTWCSPVFEAAALPRFTTGSTQPPSSDPVTIYRQLHAAVKGQDRHDAKIAAYKKSLRAVAVMMRKRNIITVADADDIVGRIKAADFLDWRPLMYVIPYAPVAARVALVPLRSRASNEPEYIITDLKPTEFHVIELMPCP